MKKLIRTLVGKCVVGLTFFEAYIRYKFNKREKINIGFIVEEFFHENLRGFGGYGMTVKNISDYYNLKNDAINVDVVLSSQLPVAHHPKIERFHNADVLFRANSQYYPHRDLNTYVKLLSSLKTKFFITIDYQPSYNYPLKAAPWVPVIIYIRDPRGEEEWNKLSTVSLEGKQRLKDESDSLDKFTKEIKKEMKELMTMSKRFNRKIIFASNADFLVDRAKWAYGVDISNPHKLQNPLHIAKLDEMDESKKPSLCFIGRLDAQKRFWMTFELAKRFKDVDFYVCGDTNTPQLMNPIIEPYRSLRNLKLLGVVTGDQKMKVIKESWGLINTSIHEGLPVTFLEAFMCTKPVISCLDPEGLVSKYGYYSGEILGEGMDNESLDQFSKQIERFLSNPKERKEKGLLAREYIENNHTFENFDRQLNDILKQEGIITN